MGSRVSAAAAGNLETLSEDRSPSKAVTFSQRTETGAAFQIKRWRNMCNANINFQKARLAILALDDVDFKEKTMARIGRFLENHGKRVHSPVIHYNLKSTGNRAAKYIKQR